LDIYVLVIVMLWDCIYLYWVFKQSIFIQTELLTLVLIYIIFYIINCHNYYNYYINLLLISFQLITILYYTYFLIYIILNYLLINNQKIVVLSIFFYQ
jgi:hypothetical protein